MKITNKHDIHLSMAVFLAHDEYDYDSRENHISATGLLNSPRQIILAHRSNSRVTETDISDFVPAGLGNAVHDAIEHAWLVGHKKALRKLGYSETMIARVKLNPDPSSVHNTDIPIYLEQRREREIMNYVISGKYDFVGNGELTDHKTTGVYSYMMKTNEKKYQLQGSIYRWLNPDIITQDTMIINYFFTDWSKLRSMIEAKKGYPQCRSVAHKIPLLSISETEAYIRQKLTTLNIYWLREEQSLPVCTQEELWQGADVFKYYKNPQKKARATKNFDTYAEAHARFMKDGSVGVIDEIKGQVKRCEYCNGVSICSQAKQLILDGLLNLED